MVLEVDHGVSIADMWWWMYTKDMIAVVVALPDPEEPMYRGENGPSAVLVAACDPQYDRWSP